MLVVIIIGGIYSGIFTATEAAAMAAVYAFFISVYRLQGAQAQGRAARAAATPPTLSAMLLYIITNAVLFSFVLTNENIPQALADWISARISARSASCCSSTCCCCSPATSWSRPRSS